MKKIFIKLITLFLFCVLGVAAQQDQIVNGRNAYIQVATGVTWGSLSSQVYLFTPVDSTQNLCLYVVNNNPTNNHTFILNGFQTGDSSVTDYSHNTGRWNSVSVTGNFTVNSSTTNSFFIKSNNSAKLALAFSGATTLGGVPDTADIYGVQSSNITSCGNTNTITDPCNSNSTVKLVAVANVTSSGAVVLITGTPNQKVYVCGYILNSLGAATAPTLQLQQSLSVCTTPQTLSPTYNFGTVVGAASNISYGGTNMMFSLTQGANLCYNAGGGVAAAAPININVHYVQQ